jgi:hypothetical protein
MTLSALQTNDISQVKNACDELNVRHLDPETMYLMYQVSLRDENHDSCTTDNHPQNFVISKSQAGREILESLLNFGDDSWNYVVATVSAALRSGSRKVALDGMSRLLRKQGCSEMKPNIVELYRYSPTPFLV